MIKRKTNNIFGLFAIISTANTFSPEITASYAMSGTEVCTFEIEDDLSQEDKEYWIGLKIAQHNEINPKIVQLVEYDGGESVSFVISMPALGPVDTEQGLRIGRLVSAGPCLFKPITYKLSGELSLVFRVPLLSRESDLSFKLPRESDLSFKERIRSIKCLNELAELSRMALVTDSSKHGILLLHPDIQTVIENVFHKPAETLWSLERFAEILAELSIPNEIRPNQIYPMG